MPIYTLKQEFSESGLPKKVLFVHIPKTGGTSIEQYLCQYYHQQCHIAFSEHRKLRKTKKQDLIFKNKFSPQHQTYQSMISHRDSILSHCNFDVLSEDVVRFTVVRNPYHRLISEVFFNRFLRRKAKNLVRRGLPLEDVIAPMLRKASTNRSMYDNHILPQHKFLFYTPSSPTDAQIHPKMHILSTETLEEDLRQLGFFNYTTPEKTAKKFPYNLQKLLTSDTIKLINNFYRKDFKLLGYKTIKPSQFKYDK